MSEGLTLFDLFEEFLDSLDDGERRQAERWINLFKSYLATYGGIAVEEEEWAEEEGEDWPAPEPDLEDEDEGDAAAPWLFVPVDRLGADHVADFLGWYLVQYVVLTTAEAGEAVAWVGRVLESFHRAVGNTSGRRKDFDDLLQSLANDLPRVVQAKEVLTHAVQSGTMLPPFVRGRRVEGFQAGYFTVVEVGERGVLFDEVDRGTQLGPLPLPQYLKDLLRIGDTLNLELGLRGGVWSLLEVGHIYPPCIFIGEGEQGP